LRIASLLASGTEILFGLGLGDSVVAVSHECNFPPEANDLPRVTRALVHGDAASAGIDRQVRERLAAGQALYAVDVDRLAELQPDLIVTQAQCEVCAVHYRDVLAAVADVPAFRRTRVVALNPMSLEDVFRDILRVGAAAGVEAGAREFEQRLRRRVAAVREKCAVIPRSQRPRTICVEWVEPLMVAANWMPELIEAAGGMPGITTAGSRSEVTSWEAVVRFDPQVVVIVPCGFDLARATAEAATMSSMPQWESLAASRSNRVYAADGDAYFNRSGPRLVDSLELLASMLHPGHVPPPAQVGGAISRLVASAASA
jgi:iron complex transport system substrate-binding protein